LFLQTELKSRNETALAFRKRKEREAKKQVEAEVAAIKKSQ